MMKRFLYVLVTGLLFASVNTASAQCSKTASSDEAKAACAKACSAKKGTEAIQFSEVTKEELKNMIESDAVVVVDARNSESYTAGHIDGAVNFASATLPADKNATLVFYCGGGKCPLAAMAANEAKEAGYTNIKVFKGGWSEWNS